MKERKGVVLMKHLYFSAYIAWSCFPR